MSESMGKETKQNSSKSDKKNINHIDNRRKKSIEPHFLSDKRRRISGAVRQERMWKKYAVKTYEDTADTARKTKRRNPF